MTYEESVCPSCGSVDRDENVVEIDGQKFTCHCKIQKERAKYYRRERANIPKEYWYKGIDNYVGNVKSLEEVNDYIAHMKNYYENGIGMFLYGGYGTGKTFLAIHILKRAIELNYKNVYFTCLSDIISQFTASWYDAKEQKDFYSRMMDSDFLVIDDIGKEYHSKNNLAESVFDKVLRYREHPVIITSNKNLEDIKSSYGASINSLLHGKLIPLQFIGGDHRIENVSKALKDIGHSSRKLKEIK